MSAAAGSVEALQEAIASERAELAASLDRARREVDSLRRDTMLQAALLVAAVAVGFALAGGLGAAGRFLARRAGRRAAGMVVRRVASEVLR